MHKYLISVTEYPKYSRFKNFFFFIHDRICVWLWLSFILIIDLKLITTGQNFCNITSIHLTKSCHKIITDPKLKSSCTISVGVSPHKVKHLWSANQTFICIFFSLLNSTLKKKVLVDCSYIMSLFFSFLLLYQLFYSNMYFQICSLSNTFWYIKKKKKRQYFK